MLTIGMILQSRYQIIRLLGQGGMGAVYQAQDLRLGRIVALKENTSGDPHQFQQEASLLANLSHPNLPRVSDHFAEPRGAQYLVMDYIEGEDLELRLRQHGALPEIKVLAWLDQILDAVAYLHSRGVIHRDIKPGNIKITPQGKAVLVDFGIAKVYRPGQATQTGARAATPGFAAPEQYRGGTDARSDVYSLGATLYALLTGQEPPDAPSLLSGSAVLAPPRALNPATSVQTERTIAAAMAVQPEQRFQSVGEMRRALKGLAIAPTVATTIPMPAARGGSRAITIALLAGLLVLLGIGGGLGWMIAASATPTPALGLLLETRTPTAAPTRVNSATPSPGVTAIPTPSITAPPEPTVTMQLRPPTIAPRAAILPGRIAYTIASDINVINADGTGARQIWRGASSGQSASVQGIAWSPDASSIVFHVEFTSGGPSDWKWLGGGLWVIGSDGTNPRQLTTRRAVYEYPVWSPDGRLIAFVSNLDGNSDVYVMDAADGSNVKRLTFTSAGKRSPTWSPDGNFVAFVSKGDGNDEIYVMNADGSSPRRLTNNPADDRYSAWSPDGRSIAFQSNRDGNWEIYVMDADGSNLRRVTNNAAADEVPTWSPDSRFIAFQSDREENRAQIYVMDANGGSLNRLTYTRSSSRYPAWSPR